ncbi:MAG: hypothetical protein PUB08_07010 [Firmicutes bacterium]|nr:hypothetical protein [Bacillota bacterium]
MAFDRFSITELKIDCFAGIRGQKITFDDHCANIVVGENRTGKTSVCEFIRFMFYGLEGRADEFYPWEVGQDDPSSENIIYTNKKIGGSLELVSVGKIYEIRRYCSPTKEDVSFCEKQTGIPVEYSGSIGYALTGLDSWLFDRTLYFSQEPLKFFEAESDIDGLDRWALLFTGRENLYSGYRDAEAQKLKLMNADKTGEIDRLLEARKQCAALLDEARGHRDIITETQNQIDEIEQKMADNTRRMVILKADMANFTDDVKLLENTENAANLKKEIQANEKKLRMLAFNASKYKPLNDRSELSELKREYAGYVRAENEYTEAKSLLAVAKDNYEMNQKIFSNITSAEIDDEYVEDSRNIIDKASGRKVLFTVASIVFTAILLGAAAYFFLIPNTLSLSVKLPLLGAVAFFIVVFLLVRGISAVTIRDTLADLDVESIDDFDQLYERYVENQKANEQYEAELQKQQSVCEEKLRALQSSLSKLKKRLSPLSIVFNTPRDLISASNEIITACTEMFDLEEHILEQKQVYHNLLSVDVGRDSLEISSEFASLEKELSFTARQNDSLYAKKTELEEKLANLKKDAFSVEELSSVSDKNESGLIDLIEKYHSLQNTCEAYEKFIHAFENNTLKSIADSINNILSFTLMPDECFAIGPGFELLYKKGTAVMPFYKAGGGLSRLALIAMRVAILSKIGKIRLPMILDESLVFIDNGSIEGICRELLQKDRQVIIFSSTKDIIGVFANNESLHGAKALKLNSLGS